MNERECAAGGSFFVPSTSKILMLKWIYLSLRPFASTSISAFSSNCLLRDFILSDFNRYLAHKKRSALVDVGWPCSPAAYYCNRLVVSTRANEKNGNYKSEKKGDGEQKHRVARWRCFHFSSLTADNEFQNIYFIDRTEMTTAIDVNATTGHHRPNEWRAICLRCDAVNSISSQNILRRMNNIYPQPTNVLFNFFLDAFC